LPGPSLSYQKKARLIFKKSQAHAVKKARISKSGFKKAKFATLHQPIYFTLGVANLSSTGINQKISS